ncbi:hypothetical protein [Photobacterium nomapromontoriensis]|uniref:hypothetical protein n=1 Tax=Photobacterium nomapromontoriensis TaxID=2910237 RepID=UPI003D13EAF0
MRVSNRFRVITLTMAAGLFSGCSLLPNSSDNEITALMTDLSSCQYDDNERKVMYQAAGAGNRLPFPLLFCEGKRSETFNHRWQASRRAMDYHIIGSHFEADGYGAALIEITMPDWGALCDINPDWQGDTCDHLVYGFNAPHIEKRPQYSSFYIFKEQDKMASIKDVPVTKDTILMPLKHDASGKLIANWVEDEGASRANQALADKLGEDIGQIKVQPFNVDYDLLEQKTLPAEYQGVFYYATPQFIDYSPRPAAKYSIPLRRGVKVRGYKTSIYRALPM